MRYGKHVICPGYVQRSILPRLSNTERVDECLVWRGALDEYGYAKMTIRSTNGSSVTARVHRVVVALFYDLRDQDVDHECRNRRCINIEHLKVVSGLQNTRLMRRRIKDDAGQLLLIEDDRGIMVE